MRWQQEIDDRNRPLTDDDLDALFPPTGYKVLKPPDNYQPIRTPARKLLATPTPGAGASATPDFGVEGWEPFDDVQLVNGITAAAGWIDMAVDPSLEIAGLSEEGWEEMACFEIVSDATDYVNTNGKVSRSARVVRDR